MNTYRWGRRVDLQSRTGVYLVQGQITLVGQLATQQRAVSPGGAALS